MPQSYIIEVGDDAVGLISRECPSRPFRFFASDARLSVLDGARFATPSAAETAARVHLKRRPLRSAPFSLSNTASLDAGRYA
jgi:hypothetical protein